jgi:Holliday junction resolvase-like predicted endonuclease
MVFVTKFDGRKQPFDKNKVINTCLRLHASREQAEAVVSKIERKIYDGIPTKKILRMIFSYLQELKPEVKHQIDLREAISKLRPKPDFEIFVALILRELGYSVVSNQLLPGKCVTHEIDAIAIKDNEIIFVEVKHHLQPHTYTGVDIMLETEARLEDLREGFVLGRHKFNFSKALVVCNTKFSDHALQYAECKDISYIGWKAPFGKGLEDLIEEKRLYPITILKELDFETEQKLGDNGIVTLKQLVEGDLKLISKKIGVSVRKLKILVKAAREIMTK